MPRTLNMKTASNQRGGGLLNKFLNRGFPIELHLPSHQFCRPFTKLEKRFARGDKGINLLDEQCKDHDIVYSQFKDTETRNKADKVLASKAFERFRAPDSTIGEKLAALTVGSIMKAKSKLGMGTRRKRKLKVGIGMRKVKQMKKRQRIIPISKAGGSLPFLLPVLGALGDLAGGAGGIAKMVIDAKNAQKAQEEVKRHNKAMTQIAMQKPGSGLFLKPYKAEVGLRLIQLKKLLNLPKPPLIDHDLRKFIKVLNIVTKH